MATPTTNAPAPPQQPQNFGVVGNISSPDKTLTKESPEVQAELQRAEQSDVTAIGSAIMEQERKQPSVLTSEGGRKQIGEDEAQLDSMTQQTGETQQAGTTQQGPATTAPQVSQDKDIQATIDSDPIIQKLSQLQATDDAMSAQMIQQITQQYAQRKAEQETANKARMGATRKAGFRTGLQRYGTQMQESILGAQQAAGIQSLAKLDSEEKMLIMQARQSQSQKQYASLRETMGRMSEIRSQKRQETQDLFNREMQLQQQAMSAARFGMDVKQFERAERKDAFEQFNTLISQGVSFDQMNPEDQERFSQATGIAPEGLRSLAQVTAEAAAAASQEQRLDTAGKILDIMGKIPEGQVIDIGGVEYEGLKSDDPNTQIMTETVTNPDGSKTVRYVTVDKDTGKPIGYTEGTNLGKEDPELSIAEAKELGVAIGTKRSEVAGMMPKSEGEKPTKDQYQVAGFVTRMDRSQKVMDKVEADILALDPTIFFAQKEMPEIMKSDLIKSFEQAERSFINATLRRESGAAISEDEYKSARLEYFPQPGDNQDLITRKKEARQGVIDNFTNEAGPAYRPPDSAAPTTVGLAPLVKSDYGNLDDLISENRDYYDVALDAKREFPQYSDDDILQIIQSGGFDQVPGTTEKGPGELSEKYEAGGDPSRIGWDSTGGYSYGKYQLAHNNAKKFVDTTLSAVNPGLAAVFKGIKFGTKLFRDTWKKVAKKDPEGFGAAQKEHIKTTHYDPQAKKLSKAGLDVNKYSSALQNVVWSVAVQHGANTNVVTNAFKNAGKNASEEDIIREIYKERWLGGQRFRSSTAAVKRGVKNRFDNELQDALNMLA